MALVAGAVLVFAFAPFGIWPLAVLCLAVLFWLWGDAAPRQAFRRGWWFGVGQFGAGCWWIFISLNTFGQAPLWLSVPIMLGLVALMAVFPAAAGYIAARWAPAGGYWCYLVFLPAVWMLLEWTRGWFLTGFPWLALGYGLSDAPLAGLAPVTGVFGMSWAVALTAGVLLAVIHARALRARLVLTGGIAALWVGAGLLGQIQWTQPAGAPLRLALVQGNIEQDMKWRPEWLAATLRQYRELTEAHWDKDVIIWPEAAIPALHHQVADTYLAELEAARAEHGADLLMGILLYDFTQQRYYNAVLKLGEPPRFYFKRHLVPFGEYFPVPDFVRQWLRLMNLPYSDFTPGAGQQPLLEAGGQPLGVSICYEIVFGEELIRDLPEAALLVNVSNDAWFGDSIGPHQHFQIARLRAMETGRYLVRATNTGITAVIAPDGAVTARLPSFVADVLEAEAVPYAGATPYVRWGNGPVVALAGVMLLGVWWRRARAGS